MTPETVTRHLERRGPIPWPTACELVLADLWDRMCDHRRATDQPLPPDDLRPRLADPITTGDTQ